ncbi:hypothetical protein EI94DRAFT_1790122 [Lactarius quietus]|nr:hypothetical protein EI94DRAFT_1790122 [Lactarius quietus]
MDQHQHRSRSSSRSELALPPASISVAVPHKTHDTKLAYSLRAPPSPSASAYPSSSLPCHRHPPLPAHTSTPPCNEANTLLPSHYITPLSLSTPRRPSSHLPSPLITPSPALPTLATMSPQVLVPPPIPQTPSLHDQLRSASRSERLLRETLQRDRAASLSPRTRVRRPGSSSGRVASTSSEMFHCACTDSDEEGDDNSVHVSLLFVNPPQHQQKFAPPLQRASKSSADVRPLSRRPERHLKEKEAIPSVIHIDSSHRRPGPRSQPESFVYNAPMTQVRDRCPDRDPTWSSPESSSLSSPTSSHRQALTPSPSPPSYAPLPETTSHVTSPRGRARNHTHPSANSPPPPHHPPSHTQPHYHGHRQQATPPPTPPTFDARNASAKLRSIDGYVSFANVEGLGGPLVWTRTCPRKKSAADRGGCGVGVRAAGVSAPPLDTCRPYYSTSRIHDTPNGMSHHYNQILLVISRWEATLSSWQLNESLRLT